MLAALFVICDEQGVLWVNQFSKCRGLRGDVVEEHLPVAKSPVSERESEERCILENVQSTHVEVVAKQGRLFIVIR